MIHECDLGCIVPETVLLGITLSALTFITMDEQEVVASEGAQEQSVPETTEEVSAPEVAAEASPEVAQ